jgi:hypothetical protein
MSIKSRFWAWAGAWRQVITYDDVPGYLELSWWRRKQLDHLVIWRGLGAEGFWRAAFFVVVIGLVTLIISWRLDLSGWRSDILRACPSLVALPWLAAARKRHLRALIGPVRVSSSEK